MNLDLVNFVTGLYFTIWRLPADNKILRRIWQLPNRSHTGIVHPVTRLDSLLNAVSRRSNSLRLAAVSFNLLLSCVILSAAVTLRSSARSPDYEQLIQTISCSLFFVSHTLHVLHLYWCVSYTPIIK